MHKSVESAASNSYGRLLALLVSKTKDLEAAEDALSEAFLKAIEIWKKNGVPTNPEAWLLTTARNKIIDNYRHETVRSKTREAVIELARKAEEEDIFQFPDERLKLLFTCAHPAIDSSVRTALILQTVLGLSSHQIASAFVVKPATMAQRIVRAKAKIQAARIPYEVPEACELPERLQCVLEAIFAAYGQGWDAFIGETIGSKNLDTEAIELCRLLQGFLPEEPEALGLLAFMLFCESRKSARFSHGEFIPLDQQNTKLWSLPLIQEADALLARAAKHRRMGRFQLEAAIQSIHSRKAYNESINWHALVDLYLALLEIAPTLSSKVGLAAVVEKTEGGEKALRLLEAIPSDDVFNYRPYWVLKAYLLSIKGNLKEEREARDRAIGLCDNEAVREFLLKERR